MVSGQGSSVSGRVPGMVMRKAPVITLFFLWRLRDRPTHGYSLMQDMRDIGIAQCKLSTVYSLLAKLEKSGLVKSRLDGKGRHMRRLYQTTAKGWKLLQEVKKKKVRGLWREFIRHLLA
ncbi:Transcriptional regulator PadR-like family protein [uncultured archaeon]|nr:Transcriptional regulator PadR-like family protein [uncultured archaeon]